MSSTDQDRISELEGVARQVRRDIVRMVHGVQSGHPGGSLGCADLLVALFFDQMVHDPAHFDMVGEGQDLFFLSNGHISPVYYSVLARSGYFDVAELGTFRKIDSRLQGHPTTAEHLPGVRVATGSLGQGLSVAVGSALAKMLKGDDRYVYALTGDGELQEGQIWEAALFAAHHQVDNLIVFVDYNGQQIDGPVNEIMSLGDLPAKLRAFGWEVQSLENGNHMPSVLEAIEQARAAAGQGKPVVVLMKTGMGYGVDFMMGSHKWHGIAPNDDQLALAMGQLSSKLADY